MSAMKDKLIMRKEPAANESSSLAWDMYHDRESGAANRSCLDREYERYIDKEICVVAVKLRNLEDTAEQYGFDEADGYVRAAAGKLRAVFEEDRLYRFSYEVFICMADGGAADGGIAGRLRHDLETACPEKALLRIDPGIGTCEGTPSDKSDMKAMIGEAVRRARNGSVGGDEHRDYFMKRRHLEKSLGIEEEQPADMRDLERDPLTGLLTLRSFRDVSVDLIEKYRTRGRQLCVMLLDIRNFSAYNSRQGFEEGNELLMKFALALRTVFRGRPISRISGDNFAVLCLESDVEDSVKELQTIVGQSFKAGVCLVDDDETDAAACSDRAMLAEKSIAHDRNRTICYYREEMSAEKNKAAYIAENFENAVDEHRIKVYYQPIMRSMSGKVAYLEALSRWEDPVYGFMEPGEFIPVLEEEHLIYKLDTEVVRIVCSDYEKMKAAGHVCVPVSLNVSPVDFRLCDVFETFDRTVRASSMPPEMLNIEITESTIADDPEYMEEQICRFHDRGYEVWIDDFGAGYSSFNLLKDIDFDTLKIDMNLLKGDLSEKSRMIVSSIVDIAKKIGSKTISEGIETEMHSDFMNVIGCDMKQGFLYSRPVPLEEYMRGIGSSAFEEETAADREYFNKIAMENLNSETPLRFDGDGGAGDTTRVCSMPIAVSEFSRDGFRPLFSNLTFRSVIRQIKPEAEGHEIDWCFNRENDRDDGMTREIFEKCESSHEDTGTFTVCLRGGGREYLLYMRVIAEIPGEKKAILTTIGEIRGEMDGRDLGIADDGSTGGAAGA
jgi:diguanylate cyclase (GGDEF)-like protein